MSMHVYCISSSFKSQEVENICMVDCVACVGRDIQLFMFHIHTHIFVWYMAPMIAREHATTKYGPTKYGVLVVPRPQCILKIKIGYAPTNFYET